MPTTITPAEALHAEIAALRQSDMEREARIRRIEALQLPIMAEVQTILRTKPVAQALPLLAGHLANLTDQRQMAIQNLVAHIEYASQHLEQESARIQVQVDADAAPDADAAA